MRKLWLVMLIIISAPAFAKTYYVSTTGYDNNVGSFNQPWATIMKGISVAREGDTVYIRGGVYNLTSRYGITIASHSGTASNPICFFAYPPDYSAGNFPIFDCIGYPKDVTFLFGMRILWVQYIHVKGLEIRNMAQRNPGGLNTGIHIEGCKHITLENMVVHNVGGYGNVVYISDEVLYKNCDAYDLVDPYGENPGNDGDGFLWNFGSGNPDSTKYYKVTYNGCRVWNFSDNGFAGFGGQVELDNCWAFSGGRLGGAGCGFKYSIVDATDDTNPLARSIKNCIAACCGYYGFSPNNNGGSRFNGHYYNNFLYHNGYRRNSPEYISSWGTGIIFYYYTDANPAPNEMYANNLTYDNEYAPVHDYSGQNKYTHSNNSWDISGITVNNDDFLSLDTLELWLPRKSDGSLPDINFGKLKAGSDLIDAGTSSTGLPFVGSAPDLGWFESSNESTLPAVPVFVSSTIENATPSRLELTYNLSLANIVPAASAFSVLVNSSSRSISSVTISGTKILITLSSPVVFGDVVTVAYTKPSSNPLQTASGGQAASFTAKNVTNNIIPVSPVYVSSAIENANPSRLELTFNLSLANIVPSASAFSVMVNSSSRSINSIAISGTKVMITLSSPVTLGNVVTVSYTKPSSNPLQTPSGGQAESFTAKNVTNNVAPASPVYVSSAIENTAPSRLEMTYNLPLANIVPAASAFTVRVNSADRTVSSIAISSTKVLLTLSSPVVYDDLVTIAYTKPSTNPLQTSSGGQATSISAQSVTNNCRLPSNQPPVADILSPAKSSSFTAPATIILDVNAYDPDGRITKVEFYNGTIKIGETTTSPYLFTWKDVPAGTYSITVAATDNLNARSVSSAVTIVVSNVTTSINQLPLVSISSPIDKISIIVPSIITITAEATDVDGSISKIEFYLNDSKVAEDYTAPYTIPLEFIKAGSYQIKAVATDDLNAATISSVITLHAELDNKPEVISLYPNPNDGRFTIKLLTDILIGENRIIITRGNGKIVYSGILLKEENTRQFDLSYLESGIYIIMVFSDELIYTKKFIKK